MKKFAITMRMGNEKTLFDQINHDYINFVEELDILPIIIPNSIKNPIAFYNEFKFDGIILTGGGDVNPIFSKRDHTNHQEICEGRDYIEWKLIEFGIEKKIPILGICRGMQFINVFFGGRIIHDINLNILDIVKHVRSTHFVNIIDPIFLNKLDVSSFKVNSFHDHGLSEQTLAPNLYTFAISEDNVIIEGIYHPKYPIIGIQWHPERKGSNKSVDYNLVRFLIEKNTLWG